MEKAARQVMRTAILLMLFHFFAPFSLAAVTLEVPNTKEAVYQIDYNSITNPVILKEKDEKKVDANASANAQAPLLDLTIHGLNLQASHSVEFYYFHTETLYSGHPQVFTFLRTLLI